MRFTVQYIPLDKIKPGISDQLNRRVKDLQKAARDCMHLLIVRKNKKDGGFILLSGTQQYEYLKKFTKNHSVPCIVDKSGTSFRLPSILPRMRKRKLPYELPYLKPERIQPNSWNIIRSFMKQEPRFARLSRKQQLKVLFMAMQYKKTTIRSMKARVDDVLKKKA
jgi:hypothetical protein